MGTFQQSLPYTVLRLKGSQCIGFESIFGKKEEVVQVVSVANVKWNKHFYHWGLEEGKDLLHRPAQK